MRALCIYFVILTLTTVVIGSEKIQNKRSFCINKLCNLIQQRTNPATTTSIKKLDQSIVQTLADCGKQEPELLEKALDEMIEKRDKSSIEHVMSLKIRDQEHSSIRTQEFWKNLVATAGSIGVGFIFGYLIGSEKAKSLSNAKPSSSNK